MFETITKVLFKTNIFQYETPTISKRVLHVGKNEPDRSPPKFDNFELDKVMVETALTKFDSCGWGGGVVVVVVIVVPAAAAVVVVVVEIVVSRRRLGTGHTSSS